MANVNSILTNFTAGELSPRLYGRVDLAKYQNGARELTNLTVLPQGGARKRGGTQFIAAVKDKPSARLIEFTFSTEQAYMLEFGEGYIRFFKERAAIYDVQFNISNIEEIGSNLQVTATGHTFANGDRIIVTGVVGTDELNNREWRVANATTNKFIIHNTDGSNISLADFSAYASGGAASRIYEVATYFTAADVAAMTFTQSADTLFLFNGNWPIALLTRQSHASWTLATGNVEEGPFLDMNTDETNTVSIDVGAGTGIMTFSQDTLEASHVGALFRIWEKANGSSFGYATWAPGATVIVADGSFWEYKGNVYYVVSGGGGQMSSTASYPTHTKGTVDVFYGTGGQTAQMRYEHSGYCVVQVQSVVDTKNAWVDVVKNRVPYTAYAARSSFQWQEGAWSDKRGYPTVGTFHEQRLVAGGTEHQPTTIWGSNINAYLKFKDGDKDDETYIYTISSDRVDAIKFLTSTKRLVINCTSGEYIAAASNASEAITPTNIKISPETSFGVAKVRTVRAGPAVLFAQRAGLNTNPARRLREFVYNFQTDSYNAPDMTILSEHITKPGLVSGAFTASPDPMVWYCRSDGILVAMTYERDQQVVGWHRHPLGGSGMAKNVAVIPGQDGDEVWLIVERTIDGVTVRYIEVITIGLADGGNLEDAFYLDCALAYSGSPATNLNGLFHLEGETVDVFADGAPIRDKTISNGRLSLDNAAEKIVIGYRITSRLRTLKIEAGAQAGTAQGQIGRVHELIARLQASIGGTFGQDSAVRALDPIPYRIASEPLSEPIALFTGDIVLPFDGDWDRDRQVCIEHDDPLPFTITALIIGQSVAG